MNNTTVKVWPGRYDYTADEEVLHRATEIVVGLLTIFSAITNVIVIYIFSYTKFGKRTTIKYLYASISLSDEMFIVACLIEVARLGNSTCSLDCRRFLGLVVLITGFVSAYTMALIAFKRFHCIVFPMHEFRQKRKKLPYLLGVIWVLSIGAVLYFERYQPIQEYNETLLLRECTMLRYTFVAYKDNPYFPLIAMVVVPLTLGLVFSLITIASLLRRKLVIGDHVDIDQLKKRRRVKLRATVMITVMILSFAISWLPITLLQMEYAVNLSKMCDLNYRLYAIFTTLLMSSFAVNPVIYWYMCPAFRRGVYDIFCRRQSTTATGSNTSASQ